jgi:hypothetical protein
MQKWFCGEKYLEKCAWNVKFQEPKTFNFFVAWHANARPMISVLPHWKQPVDTGYTRFSVAPGSKKGLSK